MPPLIVASLQTITHSRPSTRPMPVMMPAPWMSPSYMPLAASGESSRNGEPGSISRSTRSRGRSLPRSVWRLRLVSSPPSAAVAMLRFQLGDELAHRLGVGFERDVTVEIEDFRALMLSLCFEDVEVSGIGRRDRSRMFVGERHFDDGRLLVGEMDDHDPVVACRIARRGPRRPTVHPISGSRRVPKSPTFSSPMPPACALEKPDCDDATGFGRREFETFGAVFQQLAHRRRVYVIRRPENIERMLFAVAKRHAGHSRGSIPFTPRKRFRGHGRRGEERGRPQG